MPRQFVFVLNPISGGRSKEKLSDAIQLFAGRNQWPFQLVPSRADGDYTFLKAHVANQHITDVIIAGGDGTINGVLAGLQGVDVQFGLLPCGSGNGLAFASGLSRNIHAALQVIKTGKALHTDALRVNNQLAFMLCGLGLDAAVAHAFAAAGERGLRTYIKKSVQHFLSAKTYNFSLVVDGVPLQLPAYFISIANSNQFGNNVTIAPKASLTDGLMDLVIVTAQNKLRLLWETLKQVTGFNALQQVQQLNTNMAIIYLQAKTLQVTNPDGAPMHIDGDPAETPAKLNVQLLRANFRLIYP